jgi:hypothetical protein
MPKSTSTELILILGMVEIFITDLCFFNHKGVDQDL